MQAFSRQGAAPAAWTQAKYFRIYKDTVNDRHAPISVYNNTRQQCIVRIAVVVADDNGNPIDLTTDELKNVVRLIDYDSGEAIPYGDDFLDHPAWYSSHVSQTFDWDESAITGAAVDENHASSGKVMVTIDGKDVEAQTNQFFVSTSATSNRGIAARLLDASGSSTLAKTNHVEIIDDTGLGDGEGKFNSSVVIRPAIFPSLPIANYGELTSAGILIAHDVGNRDHFFTAAEHRIFITYNGRLLRLRSVAPSTEPAKGVSIYAKGDFTDTVQWAVSYYGNPGKTAIESFPVPPFNNIQLSSREPGDGVHPHIGYSPMDMLKQCGADSIQSYGWEQVVIGLLKGNIPARFFDDKGKEVAEKTSEAISILDAYGNIHKLRISFNGKRVNELKLAKD